MQTMKRILKRGVTLLLTAAILLAGPNLLSIADGDGKAPFVDDGKMAFNIYGNPGRSGSSGKYDTFSIDVEGINTPNSTYLAMCNWNLDLSNSKSRYKNITGGGAYAGIQNANGRVAIMSFWDMNYNGADGEKVVMRANRVYPKGAESSFGNEGEGNNWITSYPWSDSQWYRMVIHTWTDREVGDTFIGQWLQDLTTGKWTLISYFNTHLTNSCMTGGMSQFMENFWSGNAAYDREFHFKNVYAYDKTYKKWLSWDTSSMSCGATQTNKKGTRSFGSNGEYFWGKTNGNDLVDQASYNKTAQVSGSYSITQPSSPTFGSPVITSVRLVKSGDGYSMSWKPDETGTPQQSYLVHLRDENGNILQTYYETRPEVTQIDIASDEKVVYCDLTITDIFGQTTTTVTDMVGKYTVSWNVDGTVTEESYYHGEIPSFKGTPTKKADRNYTYEFIGWDKTLRTVTKNVTYTAQFEAVPRETMLGDLNFDDVLSIRDVTVLLNILATGVPAEERAQYDINEDQIVSIQDVTTLLLLISA